MMSTTKTSLRITEIFHSLQGESVTMGLPTVFVRTTGCPLRCQYCDTAYAFHGGKHWAIEDILNEVASFQCKEVCITGGEPLAQPNTLTLMNELCNANHAVSLETSGALSIAAVDKRVTIVMDLKTPDSKECDKNKWSNLDHLQSKDQVKFVLCSREDYDWACQVIQEYDLLNKVQILFSASHEVLNPTMLADWILKDKLRVRMQIQLHKLLWQDAAGH